MDETAISGKLFLTDVSKNCIRTAVLSDGRLEDIIVENRDDEPRAGDIYVGRVERVVKKQYAFVNIGRGKNGFMHFRGENIQQGQALAAVVDKPAYGEKGCTLNYELSMSGRLAVVTADKKPVGVSHKITDDTMREKLAGTAKSVLPDGLSCIIRTNAASADDEELKTEIKELSARLMDILDKSRYIKPPCRIFRQSDDTHRLIRDRFCAGDRIIVNDKNYFDTLSADFSNVSLYGGKLPLFSEYMIESKIDKLLERKVWLDCGGFLVFDYTEAMTVIDVNTGKFTDGKDARKTALKTNIQAAREIARQLRLRNLSGIIVVDFINMKHREDISALEDELCQALSRDRLKTIYTGMTELGIAQITRQKQSLPLHMILTDECAHCRGSARVTNNRYLCDKIRSRIIEIFVSTIYDTVTLRTNADLAAALKKYGDLTSLEKTYGKTVNSEIISTGAADYYEIEGQHSTKTQTTS